MFGGGGSIHAGKRVAFFGEVNYARTMRTQSYNEVGYVQSGVVAPTGGLAGQSVQQNVEVIGYQVSFSGNPTARNLFETGGGARFFLADVRRSVRPYVPILGGWLHTPAGGYSLYSLGGIVAYSSFLVVAPAKPNGGYCGTGFGMEVDVTRRFGLRPEVRFIREFFPGSWEDNALTIGLGGYFRLGQK